MRDESFGGDWCSAVRNGAVCRGDHWLLVVIVPNRGAETSTPRHLHCGILDIRCLYWVEIRSWVFWFAIRICTWGTSTITRVVWTVTRLSLVTTYIDMRVQRMVLESPVLLFYSCCLGSFKMSSLSYVEQISGTTFCTRYVYDNRLKLFKYKQSKLYIFKQSDCDGWWLSHEGSGSDKQILYFYASQFATCRENVIFT